MPCSDSLLHSLSATGNASSRPGLHQHPGASSKRTLLFWWCLQVQAERSEPVVMMEPSCYPGQQHGPGMTILFHHIVFWRLRAEGFFGGRDSSHLLLPLSQPPESFLESAIGALHFGSLLCLKGRSEHDARGYKYTSAQTCGCFSLALSWKTCS